MYGTEHETCLWSSNPVIHRLGNTLFSLTACNCCRRIHLWPYLQNTPGPLCRISRLPTHKPHGGWQPKPDDRTHLDFGQCFYGLAVLLTQNMSDVYSGRRFQATLTLNDMVVLHYVV